MHQLARVLVHIADGAPRGAVQVREAVEPQTAQHAVDRRAGQPQFPGNPVWPPAVAAPHTHDGFHEPLRQGPGPRLRRAAAVQQPGGAVRPPAGPPLVGRRPADPLRGGRLATGQPCTTIRSISNKRPPTSTERYDVPRRPSFAAALARNPIERSGLHSVNNVSGNYT